MHFTLRNVNEAFYVVVKGIHSGDIVTVEQPSRNGPVLVIPEPVIVTYTHPRERVLFNATRDANPFFHLFESLWMLAGRNDLAPLEYYVSTFGQFSDDGETLNGAYGYRWRHAWNQPSTAPDWERSCDQLKILIDHLRNNPTSRRAVLQMWDVEDDLLKIDSSKDVCCNLSVCFSIRMTDHPGDGPEEDFTDLMPVLDMTVFNRSNDLILGMLGANVVHFSMLQEYMACALGIEVGVYNQISNNLHAYTSNWKPDEWLNDYERDWYKLRNDLCRVPLVKDVETFDAECREFIDNFDRPFNEPFLSKVAKPMCQAFRRHKRRDYDGAMDCIEMVESDDWRIAGQAWIQRRRERYERKQTKGS